VASALLNVHGAYSGVNKGMHGLGGAWLRSDAPANTWGLHGVHEECQLLCWLPGTNGSPAAGALGQCRGMYVWRCMALHGPTSMSTSQVKAFG
jgi:hypothetical protein